tara:strand:- start:22 stop:219 length:198 start_codon:yes stop_codon:yes gene_type:complete
VSETETVEEQVTRVAYTSGLWAEGVFKGTILILPPALIFAMAVGLTMGIVRLGARGVESLFQRKC